MTTPPAVGTGSSEIDALVKDFGSAYCELAAAIYTGRYAEPYFAVKANAYAALIAKVREVVRDAERYRWLKERAYCDSREQFVDGFNVAGKPGGYAEFADESVDAAISAGKRGEGDE